MLDVTPAAPPRVRRAARQELGPLYEELRPDLMRFAEGLLGDRDDAEEAVHDAFAAAVRTGPLEEPRLWLFRVTRNAAVSQLRARRRVVPFEVVESAASTAPTPQQRVELAEEVEVLRAGIDRLGEQQRAALLLRELAGCSYREIGDVLEVSEANVKILIYRARRGLESYRAAAQLPCEEARLALSAAHDGEGGRSAAARAKLHAAGCGGCRGFAGALKDQRVAFAMLVPALPVDVDGVVHAASNHVGDVVQAASSHLFQHVPLATGGGAAGGAGAVGGLLGLKGAAATTAAVMTVGAGGVAVVHPGPVHDIVPRIVGAPHAERGVPATEVPRTPKAVTLGTAGAASEAMPWGLAWERGGLVPGEDIVRQIRLPDGTTRTVVVTVPLGTPERAAVPVPAPAAPAPVVTDPAVLPLPEAPPAEEVPPVTEAPPDDGVLVPVPPLDPADPPGRDEVPVDPVGEGDEPATEEPAEEEPVGEEPGAEEPVAEEPVEEEPVAEEPVEEEPGAEEPLDEEPVGDDGSPADVPAAPADVAPAVAEDPPAVVADDAPSVDGGATPAAVQPL